MNTLAVFYSFLDKREIDITLYRLRENGSFGVFLTNADVKGEMRYGPTSTACGPTPEDAIINLAAKLEGKPLVRRRHVTETAQEDVGAFTVAVSGASHG